MGAREFIKRSNYGRDWDEVREWILDRDGHECWECGSGGELHVHHIEKMVWFETTDQAHEPNNLVTLCKTCHREYEDDPERFSDLRKGKI